MKYTDAIEYMESLSGYKNLVETDSLKRICTKLGDPQKSFAFLYMEGSEGDASVSAYIGSVLKCAGYKMGRYCAVTVGEYKDRFMAGTRSIAKKVFCELMEQIKEVCDGIMEEGYPHPAYAEVELVTAFQYFRDQGCQLVVIEPGREQLPLLNNILEEIGIQKISESVSSADIDTHEPKKIRLGLEKQKFDYGELKNLEISLAGAGQIQNAAKAVRVIQCLQTQGYEISEAALRKGLKETMCKGCFTVAWKKPYFIVNTVEDAETAADVAQSIELYFKNRNVIFIMGMLREQECEDIVERLHKYAVYILTITPPNQDSAVSGLELAAEVSKVHANVTALDSPEEAVEVSFLLAGKEDVIIALGAHSYLGKIMEIVESRKS